MTAARAALMGAAGRLAADEAPGPPPGTTGFGRDPFGLTPLGGGNPAVPTDSSFGTAPFGTAPFGA